MPTQEELIQALKLPFHQKLAITAARIEDFYDAMEGQVYCSVSGGKDSTALAHIVKGLYPDVPLVFVDTGTEFPGVRQLGKQIADIVLRPRMSFRRVIEHYGYPLISKDQATALSRYRRTTDPIQRYRRLNGWPGGKKGMISKKWQHLIHCPYPISADCCDVMKKSPLKKFERESGRSGISGTMVSESNLRLRQWRAAGCNALDAKHPRSWPLAYWTDDDVWAYIRETGIDYAPEYDMGYARTGCTMCGFGLLYDEHPNRYLMLKETHPRVYRWGMDKLGFREVLSWVHPDIKV